MTATSSHEDLLREVAPQVLGALVRRYRDFATAEDALQEAMLHAVERWRQDGVPDNPGGWLTRVASRRMTDQYRSNEARHRRELLAASWSMAEPSLVSDADDTLLLMFMCCNPMLSPSLAIPLVLRAVGGLTTRAIAAAFMVPESTMAQRISRAKAKVKDELFALPSPAEIQQRMPLVFHVLYLMFNEGYAVTSGESLLRVDLSAEAIRLTRLVHSALPSDDEGAGLLALMLFTDARRLARTGESGELVPLSEQDRRLWNRDQIAEANELIDVAMSRGDIGEYQLQAATAAIHDQAETYADTDWAEIVVVYEHLERITDNPIVTLNRAVAIAMRDGPDYGMALLDNVSAELSRHHRFHSVRGHLHEMAGRRSDAMDEFEIAVRLATNERERDYLSLKLARLGQLR